LKWWRIYLNLCSVETLGLIIYNLMIGSQPQERVLFNLSLTRAVIVVGLGAVFLGLVLATWLSFKNQGFKDFLSKKYCNSRLLLVLILLSTLLLASDLYLISLNSSRLGKFTQLYKNFEPFMVWIYLISLQTWLFLIVWFGYLFTGKTDLEERLKDSGELLILFGIFTASVMIKILFVIPSAFGPAIRGDEMHYFQAAHNLFDATYNLQNISHAPVFYPMMLSVAFVFTENAYPVIKILNVLFFSSIVFPIFLIARNFFSRKEALLISALTCLLPFHFIIPRMVLSENLYFPIFLWTILLVSFAPRDPKGYAVWNIQTGITIGILYLTRFITLSVIPAFLLSWWFKQPYGKEKLFKPGWKKLANLLLLVGSIVLTFCPWVIMGLKVGVRFSELLGFGITAETSTRQLTLSNLLIWVSLYLSYVILMLAPFMPVILAGIANLGIKNWPLELRNWIISIAIILAGFLAASVRHSWRADYNAEIPARIMGRYVLFFTPLFIITAFLFIKHMPASKKRSPMRHILISVLTPAALTVLAYAHLYGNIFSLHDGSLINMLGSIDGAYFLFLGSGYFILTGLIYFSISFAMCKSNFSLLKSMIFLLLTAFYLLGIPGYYKELLSYQNYQYLGNYIVDMVQSEAHDPDETTSIAIYTPVSATERDRALLSNTIEFNNLDNLLVLSIENYSSDTISVHDPRGGKVVIFEKKDLDPTEYAQGELVVFGDAQYVIVR